MERANVYRIGADESLRDVFDKLVATMRQQTELEPPPVVVELLRWAFYTGAKVATDSANARVQQVIDGMRPKDLQ